MHILNEVALTHAIIRQ